MFVNMKLLTLVLTVAVALSLVSSAQAGTLIAGQDYRGTDTSVNSLQAFDTGTGNLLWEKHAGSAKGGDLDPITGDLVVAEGGLGLVGPGKDSVTRHNPLTGAPVGTAFNHGMGFASGIAVHPDTGDLYLSSGVSSPGPGHNGIRRFDSSGGNLLDFTGLPGLSTGFSPKWLVTGENRLFVNTATQRSPKAFIVNGTNDGLILSGQFQVAGASGSTEQLNVNQNDNNPYHTNVQGSTVYAWDNGDSSVAASPVIVLTDTTNLQGASGLAWDDDGNLYVTENGQAPGTDPNVEIWKYAPTGTTTVGSQTVNTYSTGALFAVIEDTLGYNSPGTFLLYSPIPEPSSLLLIAMAVVGMMGLARQR